jgi:hypothetical protein
MSHPDWLFGEVSSYNDEHELPIEGDLIGNMWLADELQHGGPSRAYPWYCEGKDTPRPHKPKAVRVGKLCSWCGCGGKWYQMHRIELDPWGPQT